MKWIDLGLIDYQEGFFGLHHRVIEVKREGFLQDDILFFQEFYPVITYGCGGGAENLLVPVEELRARGFQVFAVNRGGNVTYHGPGQLVVTPILDLRRLGCGLHHYIHLLEEVTLGVLGDFGITARRDGEYTGVWVGEDKIAAIGVGLRRGVVFHGIALNVSPDLEPFSLIVPCGLTDRGVTSLARLLGEKLPLNIVREGFCRHFARVLGVTMEEMSRGEVERCCTGGEGR